MELGKDLLYLNRAQVESLGVTMPTVIDWMESAYREKGRGDYAMPAKTALHTLTDTHPGDFIHSMPAFIPAMEAAGVKVVSGYVHARELGHPYISGLYLLNDVDTGIPLAVMDCTWITMVRTGAVTGLTAKYLANESSESLGVIGTGVQGRINLEALVCTMPNLKSVRVFDGNPAAAEEYRREMSALYPQLDIQIVGQREEAVIDCDLLFSAVPSIVKPEWEFITADMIKPGATALPVDDLALYTPEAASGAPFSKFFTDDQGQFESFKEMGFFRGFDEVPLELGEMIVGKHPGRESESECIMTVNIGTGLADIATAKNLYVQALDQGIGTVLPL
ncbi:ornithine cyclodeaminase family protein [Leucobacter sp. gxy201]|uniref:ornithine cyclodeaminase family protein n=1 Tax=Leucobacter sp. gxy201 TaxID=2957200 RepID=UPI003DA0B9C5